MHENNLTLSDITPLRRSRPATEAQQMSIAELGTPLIDTTFCVIDLETTGGDRSNDMITEIGAVTVRGGEVVGTFQTLVNPGIAIPPKITMLTGLTNAVVATAPRIDAVWPSLREFIGDAVVVAHNAPFDLGFLKAAATRRGEQFGPVVLDTVRLARRLVRTEVRDCRLGTLAAHFRLQHRPSHRALDDALATTDLLHLLIERASGLGVMGLDDLLTLSGTARHPQAAKLGLTTHLPRQPGVYMFHDRSDTVLYVGKASNLRQRVRSYFGNDDRRKVGALLRETQRISSIELPDALTAEIVEQRLIAHHLPRYNSRGTRSDRYCYIRFDTAEAWPRLAVVRSPGPRGLHMGPLPSRRMAAEAIGAIVSAVPLRRCAARISATAKSRGGVCTSARLGCGTCPCTGTADPESYRAAVALVERLWDLNTEPAEALAPLETRLLDRVRTLAVQQRFEEAAELRDQMTALRTVTRRHHLVGRLRRLGTVEIAMPDSRWVISDARLEAVYVAPDVPVHSLGPPPPPAPGDEAQPLDRLAIDEAVLIARHLDRQCTRLDGNEPLRRSGFPLEMAEDLSALGRLNLTTQA